MRPLNSKIGTLLSYSAYPIQVPRIKINLTKDCYRFPYKFKKLVATNISYENKQKLVLNELARPQENPGPNFFWFPGECPNS